MYQPPTPPSQPPRRACIITLCEAARNQGNRARLYANPRRRAKRMPIAATVEFLSHLPDAVSSGA